MQIANLTIMITGAASGLGEASAKLLAQAGANIILLDKNIAAAQTLAQQINGLAIACDVTDENSIQTALIKIQENFSTPRVCINCAGIATGKRIVGKQGPMLLADFQRVIDINLIGTFNIMRLAAAYMSQSEPLNKDGERGVIINTASIAAYEGQIGQTAYSASKGGIVAMTLPAARELAQFGIRVMTIAPGIMATPMMLQMSDEIKNKLISDTVFPKRLGLPEEFAKLTQHIIENPLLNGSVIRLDGGLRMPVH